MPEDFSGGGTAIDEPLDPSSGGESYELWPRSTSPVVFAPPVEPYVAPPAPPPEPVPFTPTWQQATSPVIFPPSDLEPAQARTPEGWLPVGEETPETPEIRQAVNLDLQRIDPRWNVRPQEPTIGGLIGKGLEWFNRI